ncbi:MAG: response regulator [Chitinispirillales bacterium]|jgi:CheY-like chemotaxis protein|nr:response regulator [Chitinispirillales bacterium]
MITMVIEQFGVTLALAFFSGIVLCVAVILIKNSKAAAVKRKKTKLGLVKVAGANLNLGEEAEQEAGAEPTELEPAAPDEPAAESVAGPAPEPAVAAPAGGDKNQNSFDPFDDRSETIAIRNEQAGDEPVAAPAPKKRVPETIRMRDRKVLLVEDVATNRELVAMYFEDSGVKLDFAENGREACDVFGKNPEGYSLILMDIQMPVMDGYDAAREIRSMSADWAKQIPIIAMTANVFKEDIDLCFDAGMDDHIAKPINMESLQNKVFDFIAQGAD